MWTAKGRYGLGWIPDYPDFRDYTEGTEEVQSVLGPTGALKAKKLPGSVDLRAHCSPVEDQGRLGSCTAQAGAGLIEYWPYTDDEKGFDREPPSFCYAFAQNYQALKYFRHDPPGTSATTRLEKVKSYLSAGHPAMFGFTVYSSIQEFLGKGLGGGGLRMAFL